MARLALILLHKKKCQIKLDTNVDISHNDATWTASYNDFVAKYEKGMPIMEIVSNSDISRRTAYRYKAYYDEMKNCKTN